MSDECVCLHELWASISRYYTAGSRLPASHGTPSDCLEYLTPEYCKYSVDEKLIVILLCSVDDKNNTEVFTLVHWLFNHFHQPSTSMYKYKNICTTTKNILCDWKIVFVKEAGQSARICRTVNTMQKNIWILSIRIQNQSTKVQSSRKQIWSQLINPVWWSKSRATVQPVAIS